MSILFQPIKFRQIELRNRIVVSPMCEYSSIDGFASDWHLVHLGTRAVGGAGLVFTEAAAVTPEGRISLQDLGIWKDDHIPFLSRVTAFIESQGAVPGIQLAHAGRKASHHPPFKTGKALTNAEGAWQTIAPSAIPFRPGEPTPKAMEPAEIKQLVEAFKLATLRAVRAGFKVLEIHAAHGYLINQFLSPLSNQRKDEYGGSFENRVRLLVEIVTAIRRVWPGTMPLFVRISAFDWVEGGWAVEDSIQLARLLATIGVDLLDCSSGGISPDQQITIAPLYQVPFAEQIKAASGIPTGSVGLITTAHQADAILDSSRADLVFLGRQLLRDPYFPLHAAKELGVEMEWPLQYLRAKW